MSSAGYELPRRTEALIFVAAVANFLLIPPERVGRKDGAGGDGEEERGNGRRGRGE